MGVVSNEVEYKFTAFTHIDGLPQCIWILI